VDQGSYSTKIGLAGSTRPKFIERSVYVSTEDMGQLNGNEAIRKLSEKTSNTKKNTKPKPQFYELVIPAKKPLPNSRLAYHRRSNSSNNSNINRSIRLTVSSGDDTTTSDDTTNTAPDIEADADANEDNTQNANETINTESENNGIDISNSNNNNNNRKGQKNAPLINYLESLIFNKNRELIGDEIPSVLLSDQLLTSKHWHSYQSEILFEEFQVPSICFEIAGVLGLYSTGRLTGMCLDLGHSHTSIIPIAGGYQIGNACQKLNYMGGRAIDHYFQHLLRKSGITLHTAAEKETISQIKHEFCELNINRYQTIREENEVLRRYELPDEKPLQIGSARYRAPEVLFRPELLGLQECGLGQAIVNSMNACHLQVREKLMTNLVIIGGTSLIQGLPQRLLKEIGNHDFNKYDHRVSVYNADPKHRTKYKAKRSRFQVRAPANREFSTFIGGSVLASMAEFPELLVTREMYNEHGDNIFMRRV
jgi:centractin